MNDSAYLRRVLSLSLPRSTQRALALRSEHRGAPAREPSGQPPTATDWAVRRHALATEVNRIRGSFWSEDVASLSQRLADLDTNQDADWATAVMRLNTLAATRSSLLACVKKHDPDWRVGPAVLQVLTSSAAEQIRKKQEVELLLTNPSTRPALLRVLRALARRFPEVYCLEPVWFDRLRFWKPPAPKPARPLKMPWYQTVAGSLVSVAVIILIRWLYR